MEMDQELLCSPRKIRRLGRSSQTASSITKRSANQKCSQGSQESRVTTSTPTKRSLNKRLSISSDLSIITRNASLLEAASINEAEETGDHTSELLSLLEELSIDDRCSEFLHRPNPKIFRGKIWNFLKPKFDGTLYTKVIENIDNIEDTVFELLEQLRSNEMKGILTVIKFFVDLCGYQMAKIDQYFDFDKDFWISCEKVIKLMEFDWVDSEILDANTYIFYESGRRKTKLGVTLASAINSFLEKLLMAAYSQHMLFTKPFHKCIFHFLFYMCQSILRPIRHTGIALVRIILRVLNHIYPRIGKKLQLAESQSEQDRLLIEKEIEYSEKYIQHFFGLFAKNSFIPDPKLFMLRAKNANEMGNWMAELPQIYFQNCNAYLCKFILDESGLVRWSAVQVWKHLIKTKNVHLYVVKHLQDIVQLVQGRLNDIHFKVVVEAVAFFSVLVDHYPNAIGEDIVYSITELLYGNSYLYAKEAGFFTIKFLNSSDFTELQILQKLVELSSKSKFQKMNHFFVEAFMEHDTVLQNYNLMMEVVVSCNKETELEYLDSLFELMYYSIHQRLKGECLVRRLHSISTEVPSAHHEEIAKLFLLNLKNLFDLFEDQPTLMNYLMKIVVLIDFDILSSQYSPHLIYLLKISRKVLLHIDDEELLGNVCELFHYLCFKKNKYLRNDINKSLVNLFEILSLYLQGYLDEPGEQEMPLDLHFQKIGKLYEKFNINNYFKWNHIFTAWGTAPICRGQMLSCNHHILWIIKDIVSRDKPDEHRMKKINLETHFSEYTASLVLLMTSPDAADSLKLDAFECFCFLYVQSHCISMEDRELKDFKFQMLQSLKTYVPETLVEFFRNNIVLHKSMSFERRKKMICDWLGLILNNLTDALYIMPLFECYHTRSQEYGSLIEFVAATIFTRNQEAFFELVLATLCKLAKQVFQTSLETLSGPEARQLMALAMKFANMKEFSNASTHVLRMLHLGFKHSFKHRLYELLILLQNFLHKLTEKHYKDCLQIFIVMTPKEFKNHEYIRSFRSKLEAGKTKGMSRTILPESHVSNNDLTESEMTVLKSAKRPKKLERVKGNTNKSRAKKLSPVDDSFKENVEEKRLSKQKDRTPKSGKAKKRNKIPV